MDITWSVNQKLNDSFEWVSWIGYIPAVPEQHKSNFKISLAHCAFSYFSRLSGFIGKLRSNWSFGSSSRIDKAIQRTWNSPAATRVLYMATTRSYTLNVNINYCASNKRLYIEFNLTSFKVCSVSSNCRIGSAISSNVRKIWRHEVGCRPASGCVRAAPATFNVASHVSISGWLNSPRPSSSDADSPL